VLAEIVRVMRSVATGDLSQKVPPGTIGELTHAGPRHRASLRTLPRVATAVNAMVEALARRAKADRHAPLSSHKLELLTNMSHELRAPLHSVLVLAKLLAEDPGRNLTDKQLAYAHAISSSGGDLLALVDEIVDLSRVDARRMTVAPHDVRLPEIVDFVERWFRPLAEQKRLAYTTEVRVGLPAHIHTDPRRLEEALEYLLANALDFTEHGSITLRIFRAPPGTRFSNAALARDEEVIAFSVLDTGMGIADNERQLVFEAFQQSSARRAASRRAVGPGLGLSVARQIARLLGGEIRAESEPDRGSTLTLYLPERYHAERPLPGGRPRSTSGTTRAPDAPAAARKVLVIDRDVRSTFALTTVLERHGHRVVYAGDLEEGIAALAREPDVDLVLLDLDTPGLPGYQALAALRAAPALKGKPLVAIGYPLSAPIAADALDEHRAQCLAAGASDQLPKPIDTEKILELIRLYPTDAGAVGVAVSV